MFITLLKNTFLFVLLPFISCGNKTNTPLIPLQDNVIVKTTQIENPIVLGIERMQAYLPLLRNKKVAIVGNQTSVVFSKSDHPKPIHLVDTLLNSGINVVKVFAPEHGFRGKVDAGATVLDGKDKKTGLSIISLYGKSKKPSAASLQNVDMIIFDIQDVGVRFYTYISTLHYIMQACAENKVPLIVLDRPNPNGCYIDGPTLEIAHQSFVGMHPIPLVHGMTIGEYAKMVNGQGWLGANLTCDLTIIPMLEYHHERSYDLPIKPSPNLPNAKAINLYPSLGLFEGTTMNAGRGTDYQFQRFGSPHLPEEKFSFKYTPKPNSGAKHPKEEGKLCYGKDLSTSPTLKAINLEWLLEAYQNSTHKKDFFKSASFTIHAGTKKLRTQIEQGLSAEAIRATWQEGIEAFKKIRSKYLIYE